MYVIYGGRSHLVIPSSGVTSTSPPSALPVQRRCLLGPRWHPYIWRQRFPSINGMTLGSLHSRKNSRLTSPTYTTLKLVQSISVFELYLRASYHLLPLLNTFHFPLRSALAEDHSKYLSPTLFLMGLSLDCPPSISTIATSVGSLHS